MKPSRFPIFLVFLPLLVCTLLFSACAGIGGVKLDPAGPSQGDVVEYNFKLAIVTKHQLLQTFLDWQRDNAALLVNQPKIAALAAKIRAEAPPKFEEADRLLALYESIPRTPENASRVDQARRALLLALAVITTYTTDANSALLTAATTPAP